MASDPTRRDFLKLVGYSATIVVGFNIIYSLADKPVINADNPHSQLEKKLLITQHPTISNTIDNGLEFMQFKIDNETPVGDSTITILKIDPNLYDLHYLSISQTGDKDGKGVRRWCNEHNLISAINAGMFAGDYKTHSGYMKSMGHINNERIHAPYKSAAAFGNLRKDIPRFRIFDLDEVPLDEIIENYDRVVQNLRLIKRPRRNVWAQQKNKWSEAALGEDKDGNILFIFSRSPYSMHDFNKILLDLPIDIVCAQHLEGGPEAQIYLNHNGHKVEMVGSYETGFNENDLNNRAWRIPNVFGISKRKIVNPSD